MGKFGGNPWVTFFTPKTSELPLTSIYRWIELLKRNNFATNISSKIWVCTKLFKFPPKLCPSYSPPLPTLKAFFTPRTSRSPWTWYIVGLASSRGTTLPLTPPPNYECTRSYTQFFPNFDHNCPSYFTLWRHFSPRGLQDHPRHAYTVGKSSSRGTTLPLTSPLQEECGKSYSRFFPFFPLLVNFPL